jgi:hypothetical protein
LGAKVPIPISLVTSCELSVSAALAAPGLMKKHARINVIKYLLICIPPPFKGSQESLKQQQIIHIIRT